MSAWLHRRALLLGGGAATLCPTISRADASTTRIQAEIDDATRAGRPWRVPVGTTVVGPLRLPDGAHLIGQPGRSRLIASDAGPLITAGKAERVTLEGVICEARQRRGERRQGLLSFTDVADLRIHDCLIANTGANGLMLERSGGRIEGNRFQNCARAALFANDSTGLSIEANRIERSGENGIMVWRSAKGDDGSIIRGNRILDTRNSAGGSGEFGNAIGLYRAGGVNVTGNQIRQAAYTAIRNNSGGNVTVANNTIRQCGEVAIYAEFAFDGAVIQGNSIDDAYVGIEVTNFADHGGRLAAVQGNIVRNIKEGRHPSDGTAFGGKGIFVEGDATIAGNVVDSAARSGLQLGWGPSLRDVTATGNTLRGARHGIEISVAPGAGGATVVGNTISGAKALAIVGMRWNEVATGDLLRTGARDYPQLQLADNRAA